MQKVLLPPTSVYKPLCEDDGHEIGWRPNGVRAHGSRHLPRQMRHGDAMNQRNPHKASPDETLVMELLRRRNGMKSILRHETWWDDALLTAQIAPQFRRRPSGTKEAMGESLTFTDARRILRVRTEGVRMV